MHKSLSKLYGNLSKIHRIDENFICPFEIYIVWSKTIGVILKPYGFDQKCTKFHRDLIEFIGFYIEFHRGLSTIIKFTLKIIAIISTIYPYIENTSPYSPPLQTDSGIQPSLPKCTKNTRKHTKNTRFSHIKAIMSEIKCGKRAKKRNLRFVGKISQKRLKKSLIFHQFSVFFIENGSFRDPPTDQRQ